MANWPKVWLMLINAAICVYMYVGDTTVNNYRIGEVSMLLVLSHDKLGVMLTRNIKTTNYYHEIEAKRFRIP